jgi:hypothetical protein
MTNGLQSIKMVAFNHMTRKMEEIFPDDDVDIERMIPMFWSSNAKKFVTVPGYEADMVYDEWMKAVRNA